MTDMILRYTGLAVCSCAIGWYFYVYFYRTRIRSVKCNELTRSGEYSVRRTDKGLLHSARLLILLGTFCLFYWLLTYHSPGFFIASLGTILVLSMAEKNYHRSLDRQLLEKSKRQVNAIIMEVNTIQKQKRRVGEAPEFQSLQYRFKTTKGFYEGSAFVPDEIQGKLNAGDFIAIEYAAFNPEICNVIAFEEDPRLKRGI